MKKLWRADIARCNTDNTFAVAYKLFQNKNTVDLALIERFYSMLNDRAEDLRDEMLGIENPTFLQVYDAAIDQWVNSTTSSCKANIASITDPWHETDGMKKLWRTVKNAVTFAIQATHPITDHIIVDKVLICINCTQAYKQQHLEFKRLPDQSYASLRTHFTAAERNRQEVVDEAAQHGYGGNAQ